MIPALAPGGYQPCSQLALFGLQPPCDDERRPKPRPIPHVWSEYTFYRRFSVQIWGECTGGRASYVIKAPNTHDFERITHAIKTGENPSKLHILTKKHTIYAHMRDISVPKSNRHDSMMHLDIHNVYPSYVIHRKITSKLPDGWADLILED